MSFLIDKLNEYKELLSSPLEVLLSMGLLMFIVIIPTLIKEDVI